MSIRRCCVTINPLWVYQAGTAAGQWKRRVWSPVFSTNEEWFRDWNDAFLGSGINHLSEYPDELKQECYTLPAGGEQTFEIDADLFNLDVNCSSDDPNHQGVNARYLIKVCSPVKMKFIVAGRVERKHEDFDWITIRYRRVEDGPEGWQTILYEHGTGEGIDCLMANKDCCIFAEFEQDGLYELDIDIGTGDGLHHTGDGETGMGFFWTLAWTIKCGELSGGCAEDCTTGENPPWTPPEHPDDEDALPPFGLPNPGPGNPPTPGYRDPTCDCSNCNLVAIGVDIEGLADGPAYTEELTCTSLENQSEMAALNGGYVLTWSGSEYRQLLGTQNDAEDPGLRIFKHTVTCEPGDPFPGPCFNTHPDFEGGTCFEYELCVWKISGSLTCEDCEVGEGEEAAPGVKWSGSTTFHYQCRFREKLLTNEVTDWAITTCTFNTGDCGNLIFDQLIEQLCEVPPGCNGEVKYSNGANVVFDNTELDCVVDSSFATETLTPIGSTKLCTPGSVP